MVSLTSRAITELERLKNLQDTPVNYLRVKVSEGGCLDYFFDLSFAEKSQNLDLQFTHDSGWIVITDQNSYEHVENLTIDYLEDLMGGAFQFKHPDIYHSGYCACSSCFSLEPPTNDRSASSQNKTQKV